MYFSSSAAAVRSFRSFWRTLGPRCAPSHALFHPISDFVAGLSDELLLCPVRALSEYVASTSCVVNRPRRPFVSSRCSSRVISKYSIFFLLREVILYCRQLRRCCGAHSFPNLATSSAFFKNGFLSNVLTILVVNYGISLFFFKGIFIICSKVFAL